MKYDHFDPDDAGEEPDGPSKADLLLQVEADHYAAAQRGEDDELKVLDERHRVVKAAKSDAAARKAYFEHVEATNAPDEEEPVVP